MKITATEKKDLLAKIESVKARVKTAVATYQQVEYQRTVEVAKLPREQRPSPYDIPAEGSIQAQALAAYGEYRAAIAEAKSLHVPSTIGTLTVIDHSEYGSVEFESAANRRKREASRSHWRNLAQGRY